MENERFTANRSDYIKDLVHLVEVDDKYKLHFKKRDILKWAEGKERDIANIKYYTDYLDAEILNDPVNTKGLYSIDYTFFNYYRVVTFSVLIDEEDDDHIWKPGDEFTPVKTIIGKDNSGNNLYAGPLCQIDNRVYMKKLKPLYLEPEHTTIKLSGRKKEDIITYAGELNKWYFGKAGISLQSKMLLSEIEEFGINQGHLYNSLKTAEEARRVYEELFPKWSLI